MTDQNEQLKLHDLSPAPGSKKKKIRVGRGEGGRRGKTAGRGTKGLKARNSVRPGFEGGQTPLSMRIPGVVGATLLERMDARGVAFSTGSACHGKEEKDNHVLQAIGLSRREAKEVVRLSFCRDNTTDEIERVAAWIEEEASILLQTSPRSPKVAKR